MIGICQIICILTNYHLPTHQIVMIAFFSFVSALATLSFCQPCLNIRCATIFCEPLNIQTSIRKSFKSNPIREEICNKHKWMIIICIENWNVDSMMVLKIMNRLLNTFPTTAAYSMLNWLPYLNALGVCIDSQSRLYSPHG